MVITLWCMIQSVQVQKVGWYFWGRFIFLTEVVLLANVSTFINRLEFMNMAVQSGIASCTFTHENKNQGLQRWIAVKSTRKAVESQGIGLLAGDAAAVVKHHGQRGCWEEKCLSGSDFHIPVHHRRKSGSELRQGRSLEAGASAAHSACLLREPWATSPGLTHSGLGWALLIHH